MNYLPLQHTKSNFNRSAIQRKRCLSPGCGGTASIVDGRSSVPLQRKLSDFANGSSLLDRGRAVQRMADSSVSGMLQAKFGSGSVQEAPVQRMTPTGLPSNVLGAAQSFVNHDFAGLRVHANSPSASDIGAYAFTQGKDIHVAPGMFNTKSKTGLGLLGHELSHFVQQSKGLVYANSSIGGLPLNDQARFENEADSHGKSFASLF